MQSSVDPTPLLGGEVPLDHVVSQPMQPLVEKVVMSSSIFLVDPTILLVESVKSTKVVTSMPSSTDPTPLLGSEVSTDYVFSISNSVLSEQGGIPLIPSTPPPSPRMVSFDWNDLVEPRLPSSAPFQIRVEVNSTNIYHVLWMKEPLQVFYPPRFGKSWDLPSLCLLRMSCWLLTDVLVNIWGFFLSFLSR
jgi:hypothetical protein